MRQRKVLFITADQWRGDALGQFGHPAAKTPHLDALAAEGVTFTRHYTCAAPCGPARTTLHTGLYPFIHRSVRNGTPLDKRHSNLALEVRKAGRNPVLFGYTDSSADPREMAPADPRLKSFEGILPGFSVEVAFNEGCLEPWVLDLRKKGYSVPDVPLHTYNHPHKPAVMEQFCTDAAFYKAEDSDTAFLADKVLDYLSMRRRDEWFIHAVFLRPHPPIIAPAPYHDMISKADVPKPVRQSTHAAEASSHPYLATWLKEQDNADYFQSQVNLQQTDEDSCEALRQVYFGLIAEVDHHVGRIIAALKESGEYDDTLIIFSSDHGEMLGDHWCWGKGGYFDASNHVPLIIRDPDAPSAARGKRVERFTESVDVMPTILDWMGLAIPYEVNGASLMPWLRGETPDMWRSHVFWEFDFRNPVTRFYETALNLTPDECTLNVMRNERYKYVHFTSLPPLLFDLEKDPGELVNCAGNPAYSAVMTEFAQKLLSHRLLHAERTLTNAMLSPRGVIYAQGERGKPAVLYG